MKCIQNMHLWMRWMFIIKNIRRENPTDLYVWLVSNCLSCYFFNLKCQTNRKCSGGFFNDEKMKENNRSFCFINQKYKWTKFKLAFHVNSVHFFIGLKFCSIAKTTMSWVRRGPIEEKANAKYLLHSMHVRFGFFVRHCEHQHEKSFLLCRNGIILLRILIGWKILWNGNASQYCTSLESRTSHLYPIFNFNKCLLKQHIISSTIFLCDGFERKINFRKNTQTHSLSLSRVFWNVIAYNVFFFPLYRCVNVCAFEVCWLLRDGARCRKKVGCALQIC